MYVYSSIYVVVYIYLGSRRLARDGGPDQLHE